MEHGASKRHQDRLEDAEAAGEVRRHAGDIGQQEDAEKVDETGRQRVGQKDVGAAAAMIQSAQEMRSARSWSRVSGSSNSQWRMPPARWRAITTRGSERGNEQHETEEADGVERQVHRVRDDAAARR